MSSPARLDGRPCLVCAAPLITRVMPWSARCDACGTWRSSLTPDIASAQLNAGLDETARAAGLRLLREENNVRILDAIAELIPLPGARLLDVGSAHGWFLDTAVERGALAGGVEPDEALAKECGARGLAVRFGYFPDALNDGEQVDVITFNDVLEHIPDAEATLAACANTLVPGGVLSVNIPSAKGLGYRVATLLARLKVTGPYLRFWQHGLPSPHVHYFPPAALTQLIERHGFTVERVEPLSSIRREGLWDRVHFTTRPTVVSVASFTALWLAAPVLNRPGNSDIVMVLARLN